MNLLEVLQELGIPCKQHGEHKNVRAGWLAIECPLCLSKSGFVLGIPLSGGVAHCWHCGKLRLAEVLHLSSKRPWHKIKKLLGDMPRQALPERPVGRLTLPNGVGPLLPCHADYLRDRGLDPALMESHWGLKGIGLDARLPWRIFLPVYLYGVTVSWTTRGITANNRYRAAEPREEALPHRTLLYGEDFARHSVVVVEGPFDALKIGPGAVATFGLGFTPSQVRRIAKFPERTVAFDNEPAAQQRANQLCHALAAFPGMTRRIEIDAHDPGDMKPHEVRKIREEFLQ